MAETEAQTTGLELICTIGGEKQVSVRLPLSSAAEAEVFYAEFITRIGDTVGEVYSSQTSDNPVEQHTR